MHTERYPSFDGLRAYSALGIVMMHVLLNIKSFDAAFIENSNWGVRVLLPSFGNLVFLFMMISAFSMCCGYYERFRQRTIDIGEFYKKRYSRILPFFALLVLIDVAFNPSLPSLYEAFADLTLVFGLLPDARITVIGVGWFLGVIFVFYLLFPFFVFLLETKRRAWIAFAISIIFHFLAVGYFSRNVAVGSFNIVYCAPFFFAGGLIYLYRDLFRNRGRSWMILLGVAVVFTVLYFLLPEIVLIPQLLLYSSWTLVAVALGDQKSFLNNGFVRFVSGISMEIYLCHMLFFRVAEKCGLEEVCSAPAGLYLLYLLLTLSGAIAFSWLVKYKVFPRIAFLNPKTK